MSGITREDPSSEDDRTRVVNTSTAPDDGVTVLAPTPGHDIHGGADNEAAVLPVGSRLAEFEITGLIGQGGFGVVYEARDTALERVVAIKEYLPLSLSMRLSDGTVRPQSQRHRETFELGMDSFINEARLLAQFDHPSLLKVYRFWQERGTAYMVMPYYRGTTLRQAFAAMPGRASEELLLSIVDGLTQAIAVMHRANCYHRDIAPDNILLLEGSGRPVLLDFGAARRVITNKTQAITAILKPGYAPIEQYAETPDMPQGAWTDVYALAAVLHVAVVGRTPPPSVARLLTDSYAPLATYAQVQQRFSARLLAAIDAGLTVRPEARPQSVAAFRELLGLGEGATVTFLAPPATVQDAAETASKAVPRGKSVSRAVMAILALLAFATGLGWWMSRSEGPLVTAVAENKAATETRLPATPSPASGEQSLQVPARQTAERQPLSPRTPAESLAALGKGAASGFEVTATPRQQSVRVGKDQLDFEIRSSRAGYVYVYMLSSNGELSLLFPNLLDRYNKIEAGQTLVLPRAAWPLEAGGPPGTDRFAVLVSKYERDFSESGLRSVDIFAEFPLPVLTALEAVRGSGPSPLLGKPVCAPNAPCEDIYGVGTFEIIES